MVNPDNIALERRKRAVKLIEDKIIERYKPNEIFSIYVECPYLEGIIRDIQEVLILNGWWIEDYDVITTSLTRLDISSRRSEDDEL